MQKWKNWFPYPTFRAGQEKILCDVVSAFERVPVVILEGETGIGKSAIALALAQYYHTAYICTVEKQLQDQYSADFPSYLALLKGKNNYACGKDWSDSTGISAHYMADFAPCGLNLPSKKHVSDACAAEGICPYITARNEALKVAKVTLMNFSNFLLFATQFLPKRKLSIFDEVHCLPDVLYKYAEIPFTPRAFAPVRRHLSLDELTQLERGFSSIDEVLSFCVGVLPRLTTAVALPPGNPTEEREQVRLEQHTKKVKTLVTQIREGLPFKVVQQDTGSIVSPLFVHHVAPLAFKNTDKALLMSATIPDAKKLAQDLGITDFEFIRVESNFPPENRPIFVMPVGSMSYAHQEKTLPKLLDYTAALLRRHPNEKGLIHTHNYKIADKLKEALGDDPRLLFQSPGEDKSKLVQRHLTTDEPTVLVGPGFKAGINLKYQLCKFMLLLKMPNADTKHPVVEARMKLDPEWYTVQTIVSLLQMLGRGFRAEDDECVVYVLDTYFKSLYDGYPELFPKSIQRSVVFL
jgi:Rad3-related DNA helicase